MSLRIESSLRSPEPTTPRGELSLSQDVLAALQRNEPSCLPLGRWLV